MKKKIHYTDNYLLNPTHRVTVNLIGIGGTGSQVLTCLARIDYALQALGHPGLHVTAYDPDEITEANIGRQLFSPSDLGLNKATVLVTRINQFFGNDWGAMPKKYDGERANITISCVDTVKARLSIAKQLKTTGRYHSYDYNKSLYWLDFGNMTNTGQVVLGTIGDIKQPKSRKYETVSELKMVTELFDLTKVDEKDAGPSCSLAEALHKQDLFINSTLAQHGCALLWQMITTGYIDCNGLFLNMETHKVNPIKL